MWRLIAIVSLSLPFIDAAGCRVSINNGLGNPQALILDPKKTEGAEAFFLPTDGDVIEFKENQSVLFACPGGKLIVGETNMNVKEAEGKCKSNKFEVLSNTVRMNEINCTRMPAHKARYTGNSCLGKFKEIEAGFQLEERFVRVIKICFDYVSQNAIYSEFNLTRTIDGYQVAFPRPDFTEDGFYDVGATNVNNLYTRNTQRKTINALLGLPPDSNKYVAASGNFYLARGHLTAKADFLYGSQQRVTFKYVNVMPQWQTLNGNNWNALEADVRTFAADKGLDLIVYTGGHGVSTLPDAETGEQTELYLYVDGKRNGIAVPRFFWKVIYEKSTKAGLAFVAVNNPYDLDLEANTLCESVCDQADWLTWKNDNVEKGYGYCCDVNELRKIIRTIPDFPVTSLLV
ncbi:PREDICTED: uncharacterized protein LOC108566704 [Nicrophorus vespilloides]|uniref:Uncharacterized protein LOC108566704 n=1 Tax=Nicrophorus vespilloides TaxID=110193 RepID=A0ABM1N5W1_NICVS|nr:PREDICTED: uncharacterized protein LOC108566704 [Nicrophorus vespilloides]